MTYWNNKIMFSSNINCGSAMVKPKLQMHNTMMVNATSAGLFPLQKVATLKRKTSESFPDDAFAKDSVERHSAFTPCKVTKRRRTSSSSNSSDGQASQGFSWLTGLMGMVSSTLHECKVGVSKVYPWSLGFSMQCKALLQNPDPVTGTFGLLVLCQRTSSNMNMFIDELCDNEDYKLVGGSIKAKTLKTGSLCVRLLSHDLEADVQHGEHISLIKFERFSGRDFEMQFACKFKRIPKGGGVFGKVVVEHIDDYGNCEVAFDFNLSKKTPALLESNPKPQHITVPTRQHSNTTDAWSSMAVRELATLLYIDEDDEAWMNFATYLGYKEEEVEQELAVTSDPIIAIFKMYHSQGRDPKDFVQAMYETSRKMGLKKAGVDDNGETGSEWDAANVRFYSQQSADENRKTENAEQDGKRKKPAMKQQNSLENEGIHLEQKEHDADDLFDAATVVLPDQTREIEEMKEIPSTAVMPPTPPPTPRRRGWSESTCSSPGADRIQQISRGMNKAFCSDSEHTEDQVHRDSNKVLSDSILWQVSGHVQQKWKNLGRALDVKEVDLMCIEYSAHDPQVQAYRTLCRWRDHVVQKPTYGALYTALCHPTINLNMIANRYCTLDGVGVA